MSYTVSDILEDVVARVGQQILEKYGARGIIRAINRRYKQINNYCLPIEREWFADFAGATQKLKYDGQTANFTVGETVTGGTSGATGIVVRDHDAGTSGNLILKSVSGVFVDNETLTGSSTGAAVANGAAVVAYLTMPADVIRPFHFDPKRMYRDPQVWLSDEWDTYTIMDGNLHVANADTSSEFTIRYYSSGLVLVETVQDSNTQVNEPEWPEEFKELLLYATAIELSNKYDMYRSDLSDFKHLRAKLKTARILKSATDPQISGPVNRNQFQRDPYLPAEN